MHSHGARRVEQQWSVARAPGFEIQEQGGNVECVDV